MSGSVGTVASSWPAGTPVMPAAMASARARLTGRPVPIAGGQGLVAYPNGSIGTAGGGGFGAGGTVGAAPSPSMPAPTGVNAMPPLGMPAQMPTSILQRPSAITNAPVGSTITAPHWLGNALTGLSNWGGATLADILGGANQVMNTPAAAAAPAPPAATAAAPADATPGSPGIYGPAGLAGQTQYGPQTPQGFIDHHARVYRVAHGIGTPADADALNAMSLAAAQAGRTTLQPGPFAPGTNVVANALTAPAGTQPTNLNFLASNPQYLPAGAGYGGGIY